MRGQARSGRAVEFSSGVAAVPIASSRTVPYRGSAVQVAQTKQGPRAMRHTDPPESLMCFRDSVFLVRHNNYHHLLGATPARPSRPACWYLASQARADIGRPYRGIPSTVFTMTSRLSQQFHCARPAVSHARIAFVFFEDTRTFRVCGRFKAALGPISPPSPPRPPF